jgi:UDP-2-acetamido-3-amino-2,3-dideoxy-glucuronate N-acetyltransferase
MIHETAQVSPLAFLGEGVKIWNHAQVRGGAVIGSGSVLSKNVYVCMNVKIGENCKIQNNCSIYHGVELERGVFVGPHCVFTNDKVPRAINVDGSIKSESDWDEGKTIVKEGASIGARSVVLPNVVVGKFALIGAGSVVTKSVPDFGLVYGNPARLVGFVCYCGKKLGSGLVAGDKCGDCSS